MSRAGSSPPPADHDQLHTNCNGRTFALTPPAILIVTASGSRPVKLSVPPTTRKSFDWVTVTGGSPTDMIWRESDGSWYVVWRISAEAGGAPTIATKDARITNAATVLIEFPPHEVLAKTL